MNEQHRILDDIHFSKSGDGLEKFLADGLEIIFGNPVCQHAFFPKPYIPSSPQPTL
jgi:hypothetical protein